MTALRFLHYCSSCLARCLQARANESQKLAKQLFKTAGIQLITKLKRNMKQRLMPLNDQLMLALARPISKPLLIS